MAWCLYAFQLLLLILYITDISRSTNVISCLQSNCKDTTINCPNDGDDCFISCSTPDACNNAIINCPQDQECVILCDDTNSCKNSTFNGQYSSTLYLTGCNQYESCFDITIHCPPHTNDINCFLEGNDNLGSYISIYAINGWNDIDIDYNGTFNNNLQGTMYCNIDYDISCSIALDKWSCINDNDICNYMFTPSTTNINNNNNNNNNSDTEMIIIVSTLIVAFCFISLCCCYNNKNRNKISTNTDSNTMKHTIDGNNTDIDTDTNYTNKVYIKGEISKSKSKSTHQNHKFNANPKNDIVIKYNDDKIIHNKHIIKHSATITVTASKSTHPTSKSNSAMSVEIATDVDITHNIHNKRNITINRNYNNNNNNIGSDINMVDTNNNSEYIDGYNRYNNNDNIDNNIYKGSGDNNISVINADINQRNYRRKNKEIHNISVQEYKNSNEDKLEIINEQQATPNNLGNDLKCKREQLQFKPNTSDSEPMFMKSPDTWSNFEKENGILDDQYAINQMMGYLEEGAIACSYD